MNKIIAAILALTGSLMLLSEPEAGVTLNYMFVWYLTAFLMQGVSYLLWKSGG